MFVEGFSELYKRRQRVQLIEAITLKQVAQSLCVPSLFLRKVYERRSSSELAFSESQQLPACFESFVWPQLQSRDELEQAVPLKQ